LSDDVRNKIGHEFKDPGLLKLALTHSSVGGADNERLEFLGDRVLGVLIADLLIQQFPGETEGSLALKLNALVREETCARVAMKRGPGCSHRPGARRGSCRRSKEAGHTR
jgi:ribonuclease-3